VGLHQIESLEARIEELEKDEGTEAPQEQPWHVHVYNVCAKGEVNVVANTEEEARKKALDLNKEHKVKFGQQPESSSIAVAFKGEFPI